jgi:ABC-type sugar transport system ATPase subunit
VINFNVRRGEVLGIAGMVGSGRTGIVRAIAAADKRYAGDVLINGKKLSFVIPGKASRLELPILQKIGSGSV